jgi:hypothetical protein
MANPDYLCAASAQATAAQSTPTAHWSTTQIASCQCKKLNRTTLAERSTQLETKSIYETDFEDLINYVITCKTYC